MGEQRNNKAVCCKGNTSLQIRGIFLQFNEDRYRLYIGRKSAWSFWQPKDLNRAGTIRTGSTLVHASPDIPAPCSLQPQDRYNQNDQEIGNGGNKYRPFRTKTDFGGV